jgi:replication factor A1
MSEFFVRYDWSETFKRPHGGAARRQYTFEIMATTTTTTTTAPMTTIAALSPQLTTPWCIVARVTQKTAPKAYSGANGGGTVFACTVTDGTGDLRCSFFNEAANKFAPLLCVGKTYRFGRGNLKAANKKFTSAAYECTFYANTEIAECAAAPATPPPPPSPSPVPKLAQESVAKKAKTAQPSPSPSPSRKYTTAAELESMQVRHDTSVDVIGVVRAAAACTSLTSRAGKPLKKRDLTLSLMDDSGRGGADVRVTLWGDDATAPDELFDKHPVLAITAAKVGEFRGQRTLSTSFSSTLTFYPTSLSPSLCPPEAQALHDWFGGGASRARTLVSTTGVNTAHLVRQSLSTIASQKLGLGDKPDYITVKGIINMVRTERMWYPACTSCNKKAEADAAGRWACSASTTCGRRMDRPTYRYMLTISVCDNTASYMVTLYDDCARLLLGVSADEAEEMQHGAPARFAALLAAPLFTMHLFEVAVKEEIQTYAAAAASGPSNGKDNKEEEEKRWMRVKAMRLHSVKYAEENQQLLTKIRALEQ